VISNHFQHKPRALGQGEAADARAERRKGDRRHAMAVRGAKSVLRRALDDRRGRDEILAHDRGVNHGTRRQAPTRGYDTFARGHWSERHRLLFDLITASRFECAGDAAAHPEVIVRSVDDSINVLFGDIAVNHFDFDRSGSKREHASSACGRAERRQQKLA
jgi:hypothetical protein